MPESGLSPISPDDMLSDAVAPALPAAWSAAVESRLSREEKVAAWLETDLNGRLHFDPGLVVVTNKRLLVNAEAEGTTTLPMLALTSSTLAKFSRIYEPTSHCAMVFSASPGA